jgi:hypothetical protein
MEYFKKFSYETMKERGKDDFSSCFLHAFISLLHMT